MKKTTKKNVLMPKSKKIIRKQVKNPDLDVFLDNNYSFNNFIDDGIPNKNNGNSGGDESFITNGKLIKKKIKRKKPGTGPSKTYFGADTQKAIVDYQDEPDPLKKEQIYVKKILPAFDSLIENLINVYGFKVQYDSKEDLKNEALEFLHRTISKYDNKKNFKAFSYFNVVGKHWLTIQSKKNAKRIQQYISLDDTESMSVADSEKIESYNFVPSYDEMTTTKEMRNYIVKILQELNAKAKTTNEQAVLVAVEDILNNIDNLEFLNKRALLIYVREISSLNSKQLSMTLSSLKKQYKELKKSDEFSY